jgi:hypothetical protein
MGTARRAAATVRIGRCSRVRPVPVALAEHFRLLPGEPPFDLAFAIRVGALGGRHPEAGMLARQRIAAALTPMGGLIIDGGDPLRLVDLHDARAPGLASRNSEPPDSTRDR